MKEWVDNLKYVTKHSDSRTPYPNFPGFSNFQKNTSVLLANYHFIGNFLSVTLSFAFLFFNLCWARSGHWEMEFLFLSVVPSKHKNSFVLEARIISSVGQSPTDPFVNFLLYNEFSLSTLWCQSWIVINEKYENKSNALSTIYPPWYEHACETWGLKGYSSHFL